MLLQALHQYATDKKLLDRLPFQVRTVHLLISLNKDGTPRGSGFNLLTTPSKKKTSKKEVLEDKPGVKFILPRYPGEKNNTKAQYLVDPLRVVLGLEKDSATPLQSDFKKTIPDNVQQFQMFWRWIDEAYERLSNSGNQDVRLSALRSFREKHLESVRKWITFTSTEGTTGKPKLVATLDSGFHLLKDGDVVGFEIDGTILAAGKGKRLGDFQHSKKDELWSDWESEFITKFQVEVGDDHLGLDKPSVCLITGRIGERIAAIHKPEIKIPGTPPKGASFYSVGSDAFQSYGLGSGGTASISIQAASGYAIALEDILASEDCRIDVGGVTFCFWTKHNPTTTSVFSRLMNIAKPHVVIEFMKSPFAGVERGLAKADQFLSVGLSANGGRIMVREWLQMPLEVALINLVKWFHDLEIASLGETKEDDGEQSGPLSLFRLAVILVRESGELERMSDTISLLYHAALENTPPPLRLIEPLLAEFHSALVTNSAKKPKFPFSHSRFALLKLILLRHSKEGGFMPVIHLCETDDLKWTPTVGQKTGWYK